MKKEKFQEPSQPVRWKITRPSECGRSVFLANLILNFLEEFENVYIYSTSLHQDLYQKLIKCFVNYIPIHLIRNILNEEDIDVVTDEVVFNKDCKKSGTEIEAYESIEQLKFSEEYQKWSHYYPRWSQRERNEESTSTSDVQKI